MKLFKNVILMLGLVLIISNLVYARMIRNKLGPIVEETAQNIKEGFNIGIKEARNYSKKLREATERNKDDFSYYLKNILDLASPNILKNFVSCINAIRDREKVSLVFQLVRKLDRFDLSNREYEIGSVLEDAGSLNKELSYV